MTLDPLSPETFAGNPATETDTTPAEAALELSVENPKRKIWSILRSVGFFFLALTLFTLFKIPEARIQAYIQGSLASALAPRGIVINPAETDLSFLLGLKYTMKDVSLVVPELSTPLKIERIEVSPSLLPLVLGKMGGTAKVIQGDGSLRASFSINKEKKIDLSFSAKELPLAKLGVLPIFAKIQGSGLISGDGHFSGLPQDPSSWNADCDLSVSKFALDAQSLMGFKIPAIRMSEAKIELSAASGKATIKTFRLGKSGAAGSSDDLSATLTGSAALGKTLGTSNLNLNAQFRFSEAVSKSLSILDLLLSTSKQPDGSYAGVITGSLAAPQYGPKQP